MLARMRRRFLTGAVLAVALAAAIPAGSSPAAAAGAPACFGAVARDPLNGCANPALDFTAIPSPFDAVLEPSAACALIQAAAPEVCAFGIPLGQASATVALLG